MYNTGKYFYEQQNYQKAYSYFIRSSNLHTETDKERSLSLHKLAIMFRCGYGVTQDFNKAIDYYKQSAKLGNALAMFQLGKIYQSGDIVPKDYQTAALWYEQGAKLGNNDCQINLGGLYDSGKGVPQSFEKAFYWYSEAAKQGDIDSIYNLGLMYEYGEFVPIDIAKAQRHYCDAGEYDINNNIDAIQVVKANEVNSCKHKPKNENQDLNSVCENWIRTQSQ